MSVFNTHTLTVTRKTAGSYIDGKWVPGSESTFTIQTSWQPANGADLQILEEGKRQSVVFKAYPVEQMLAADPKTQKEGDMITGLDGHKYEVIFVAPNQNAIIPQYKVLAIRTKEIEEVII